MIREVGGRLVGRLGRPLEAIQFERRVDGILIVVGATKRRSNQRVELPMTDLPHILPQL
jgi:hypothetical protein